MSDLSYTPLEQIPKIHATLKKTFDSQTTLPLQYRKNQLYQLARLVRDNKDAFVDALHKDLGKQKLEVVLQEVNSSVAMCIDSADNLEEWAKPEKPKVEPHKEHWNITVNRVPKGAALIISPWNYPLILTVQPLIGAIAAGCTAAVKTSEYTPTVSKLFADLFPKYLDANAYIIVKGAIPEVTTLLQLQWDHIFYTGNGKVARIISAAAAKHLTPLTLELGGQCPVIIDPSYDIKLAAKRILWGKVQNSGQLCVTPNHVLVTRDKQEELIEALKEVNKEFYPNGALHSSSTFGRIVNPGHFRRLKALLERTKGKIVFGGGFEGERGIEPTVVRDVPHVDSLLEEELFGPILPLVPVDSIDEAIQWINNHPHPLALYTFTEDEELKQKVLEKTNSGSLIFNDCVTQVAVHEAPFGGHGESGHGYQFSYYTFQTFSHFRSSLDMPKAFVCTLFVAFEY
ncbi:aldehyde dehydrogenase [Sistotremastrum niveocremeum HHB9708]|uniref:Aldehyde dehydrogenase n=1 Tax=Sistotremastrum niveocremeum HHB9708 TaxID=1314777 RepID=A0A164YM46_9AGAM|nr:aldehyde dehydrogenase [Sistotremastrum niveocremeum HHB9708]